MPPAAFGTQRDAFVSTRTSAAREAGGYHPVVELASLIDPSLPAPFVPASVFTGFQSANYWSATTNADNSTNAWNVNFNNGNVNTNNKTNTNDVWYVRGPMQESFY